MLVDTLTSIGLSEKEASVYLALLEFGVRPISFIARKTNLNRGTTYVVLHALLNKGLTYKTSKGNVQYFSALEPKHLLQYLDNRKEAIETQREKVQEVLGQLTAITSSNVAMPRIEFLEGKEGAREALENTLTAKEPTLFAFLSIADITEVIGEKFFDSYTSRRIKAGYTLHAIRTYEKDKRAMERNVYARRYLSNKKEKREVRYASEALAFPISMYMYDSKLAIISSKEENFALIIESRELAEMQKKLFSLLWDSAVRLKQRR